jgi:hypothetical protein
MWELPRLAEIAQTWFKRAGGLPLSVTIHGYPLSTSDAFHSFVKTFQGRSQEMCSLELNLRVEDFADIESRKVPEASYFPLLQQLSIGIHEESGGHPDEFETIEMFKNASRLHEVLMRDALPSFFILPWEQLTKFTGQLYSVEDCLEAIRLMPNLIECIFSALGPSFSDTNRLEMVSHPKMQHLTLPKSSSFPYYYCPSSAYILTFLTLPALLTLEILGTEDFDVDKFYAFLERSSPPLRKLAVHPLEGELELQLSPPFMALIGLVELEIWRPARNFLSSFLTTFGCDPKLLPQLQNLTFLGRHIPEDEKYHIRPEVEPEFDEILRDAAEPVTKRREILPGCAQLQSFRVISEDLCESAWYSEEDLLPFRKLKESGMYVHIGTETRSVL